MNVALIIFNRPQHTEQVFSRIAAARPEKLFVIADGAREGVPGEAAKVAAARAVTEAVDWPCEVQRNYAPHNLGCGIRPATGISWVFEHVEDCIILEDDCVPDATFFPFCQEMLIRYRNDERVMSVSGDQFLRRVPAGRASYVFSRYPLVWGWATWRRAWAKFDYNLARWPDLRGTSWLPGLLGNERAAAYWSDRFDVVAGGRRRDIWDITWVFACLLNNGLSIHPATNLVANMGFGAESTHTVERAGFAGAATKAMVFPLRDPRSIRADGLYETRLLDVVFSPRIALWDRIKCRYTYGTMIRRLPVFGRIWTRWRERKRRGST